MARIKVYDKTKNKWVYADSAFGSSGGGSGDISLTRNTPLLYDLTTTEEVRWIDTGDNAFEAKNFIIVELLIKATASSDNDFNLNCSMYPLYSHPSPWDNQVLGEGSVSKTYDRLFRSIAFRGDDDYWTAIFSDRNVVNATPYNPKMKMVTNTSKINAPIRGIIIGDNSANTSTTKVLGIGSRLRVWGY